MSSNEEPCYQARYKGQDDEHVSCPNLEWRWTDVDDEMGRITAVNGAQPFVTPTVWCNRPIHR